MAKHPDPANEVVYEVATNWIDECLDRNGSLLTPGASIWTLENIEDLFQRVWVHGDSTPGSGYYEKLHSQLTGASPQVVQLAAEVNAVHFVSIWPGALASITKRKGVEQVLSWMPPPVPPLPPQILEAFDHGLAHPGRWAMQRRDTQISFLLRFGHRWKEQPPAARAAVRSDPWQFATWSASIVDDPQWENQRQMVLHLFHPDHFEPIVHLDHKRLITSRFKSLAADETDLDKQLLAIRTALTPVEGARFNWYDEPRINRWLKDKPKWSALCKWAEAFRALPDFEEAERTYKLKAVEPLQASRSELLAGGDNWYDPLRRGFQNTNNNITNWQAHDTFLKWVAANGPASKAALEVLWGEQGTEVERVRSFLDVIPEDAIDTPGNRLTIASYLLMAEDPMSRPPYKPSAIKAAWALAGWKTPPIKPEYRVYDTFLVLCDELVHSCASLNDRLDAQGALWAITKWKHDEKPPTWTDAEWAQFLAFRAGNVAEPDPGAGADDGVTDAADELIAKAAAELHLNRAVLDHIVELLEDKRQVILYGPPGTGKTYLAKKLAHAIAGGDVSRHTIVQFHPAMSYEDFVEGFRPDQTPAGHVTYTLRDGHLMRMAKRAAAHPHERHVMVIDEINRANLPKVLGELLFLLEYRGDAIPLLYQPEAAFQLPDRLWFIGTMNTADRSIALIDAALRRRFHFVPFFPTQPPMDGVLEQFLEDRGYSTAPAAFLRAVNKDLLAEHNIDEHVLIGPSYFMNPNHYVDGVLPESVLERTWTYNVFPLIEELLWGQRSEIDEWRWGKVRVRYTTVLGLSPSNEQAGPDEVVANTAT